MAAQRDPPGYSERKVTGPDGVGPRRPGRDRDVETLRSLRWLAVTVPAAILVGSSLFLIFGSHWWTRPYGYFRHAGPYHADSTVLVSTLVLVYTFFIAAYGVITPLLVGKGDCFKASQIKKGRVAFLRLSALVLMAGAVILDLVRLANSVGDLCSTRLRCTTCPRRISATRRQSSSVT